MLRYILENEISILRQIGEHLFICLIALAIAALIGILGGYHASKSEKLEKGLTRFFEVLRVIPSLALLILFIPVMGTGVAPAVTALMILAIPPILLNTIVGFQSVPAAMIEAGEGMGMDHRQVLWKIRVPLALPMILSGVRTALVEIVASATLAAKIGAGGLGEIIFTGLGLNRPELLLLGGVLVAVLSLGTGLLFDRLWKKALPYL